VFGPGVEGVGGAVGAAEAFALADEIEQVGFLLVAKRELAAGEEIDGVEIAEGVGVDQGDVFGVDHFERAGSFGEVLEHLDGGGDAAFVAEAVGGGYEKNAAGGCLQRGQGQERYADELPPAGHGYHFTSPWGGQSWPRAGFQ